MQLDLERKTAFSVGQEEVVHLLQDVKRFLVASGSSEEESIRYDGDADLWHATSKSGVPMLPKPTYTAQMEETEHGARWTIETGLGIKMMHTWLVQPISDQECTAEESVVCHVPFFAYYAVKWQLPQVQAKTHKALQEYLS